MSSLRCLLVVSAVILGTYSLPWDKPVAPRKEHICGGLRSLTNTTDRNIAANHVLWGSAGDGLVPYQFGVSCLETDKPLFREAMDYIQSVSCVRFEERTGQETYLEFDRACDKGTVIESCGSCSCFSGSYVDSTSGLGEGGRVRLVTGTTLNAGDYQDKGHITHELLHALGHHHTQKRADRDDYITIDMSKNSANSQYYKCTSCDTMGTAYDCMSIMHYRDWGFAIGNDPTMVAIDPATCDLKTANRWLRWSDIDLLNANYQCQNSIPLVSGDGVLTSADTYPESYPIQGSWIKYLEVAEGNTIELTFVDEFGIEAKNDGSCPYDWVSVVDGNGLRLIPRSCGTSLPASVTSTTNRVYVEFVSDSSTVGKGFKLQWREVGDATTPAPTEAPTTTTVAPTTTNVPQTGDLTSPNYPRKYANNLDETYTVEVDEGKRVEIEFTAFNIQANKKCAKDWLMIEDDNGDVLLEKSCGSQIPVSEIVSSTNKIKITFHTDSKKRRTGWALTWTSVDDVPTPKFVTSPNYPENYDDNLEDNYSIVAPGDDDQVAISFAHFDIESDEICDYDYLMIVDGDGTVLMDKTCGSQRPNNIMSNTNKVEVIFKTDSSVTMTGFKLEWRVAMT